MFEVCNNNILVIFFPDIYFVCFIVTGLFNTVCWLCFVCMKGKQMFLDNLENFGMKILN